ncbi:MAG: hypothetical protein KatS3mg057_1349 [Herpetosiphonaceae bacterium]|nr:MAG: hypothetical protein KatS3mg057_1349 [Herpetosiphonaceae bacterium]
MISFERPPCYRSYLLRFREVQSESAEFQTTWYFYLEDPDTGDHFTFSGLDALISFLNSQLGCAESSPPGRAV